MAIDQAPAPGILLVDDKQEVLDALQAAVKKQLKGTDVEVDAWLPSEDDGDPIQKLDSLIGMNTVLVATDYDLTSKVRGLFGLTVVARCQQKLVPVGDFSRGNIDALPKEPSLFELRVPNTDEEGASFIASTFHGFVRMWDALEKDKSLIEKKMSLAAVLASLLGKPDLENQFALYMARLGASNSSILERIKEFAGPADPSLEDKRRLLVYVLGHVLCNAILKYPGPILSASALTAYCATAEEESAELSKMFEGAAYEGPFGQFSKFFWRDGVDEKIEQLSDGISVPRSHSFAEFNRLVIEERLGRPLSDHSCSRCGGKNGGFWCPFTHRPVCMRDDCSVPTTSWVPQGAQLCRVEKDFYEEWAPLLGL
ncbi:hypothetical protein [Bradyrhizobium sp. LMTR 3]|uniref:hypothetical protein n=1 Tax=Bradyrhizobium sp. LMTR 3 TaxID=189873 RepID=UPI000810AD6B|nr:hypothetical protein [Bradyrhizobium sp. LMTR 3]OCK60041.1 hypothetical protein LMTR3_20870 [Bradyrhizobium sp. LMTR 3]